MEVWYIWNFGTVWHVWKFGTVWNVGTTFVLRGADVTGRGKSKFVISELRDDGRAVNWVEHTSKRSGRIFLETRERICPCRI